jgi:GNAT superfamily N-acetyltransferase
VSVTHHLQSVQDASAAVPATSARAIKQFVELPYALYKDDPHWVPPLRRDEYRRLDARRNAFLAHADLALWIALDAGRPRGRIAAIEDHAHNAYHHERIAWFGFFEAETASAAAALLSAAEGWSRARGCTAVRGPVNPSLNESAGLLIEGFDDDPCLLMPYNPPHYAAFIESHGYTKAKDLLAWKMDLAVPLGARIERLANRLRRRADITIRRADMKAFDRDLGLMNGIYRSAWEDNWGFVPPNDAEMKQLAADLKPVVDPDLVLFAELHGRAVACAVALPDFNEVLKRMKGDLLPFGLWHFLNRRAIITRARLLLLGVLAEYRNAGLYPLLISEIHRRGVANGYRRGELSWTLEDNHSVNAGIAASGGIVYKKYRIYEKPLG